MPTAPADNRMPKASASSGSMRPCGSGRARVRSITASISRSYHMFTAPDAPAPAAMHSTATAASNGCSEPGAIAMPTSPVNTTSDMTRGFSSAI